VTRPSPQSSSRWDYLSTIGAHDLWRSFLCPRRSRPARGASRRPFTICARSVCRDRYVYRLRTAPISSSSAGVSTRRKGARINRLLVSGFAVQFDKIDQHQPVRRLTILLGRSKLCALVEPRHPYPQLGLPIPQWGAIGRGLCQVVLQPLLVAQLLSLAQILSLERQRRRRSILPDGGA